MVTVRQTFKRIERGIKFFKNSLLHPSVLKLFSRGFILQICGIEGLIKNHIIIFRNIIKTVQLYQAKIKRIKILIRRQDKTIEI